MSTWQQQIAANAAAIQQIINNSKKINEHDPLSTTLQPDDSLLVQIESTGVTVHLTIAELAEAITIAQGLAKGWIWSETEGCEIKKASGNVDYDAIEDGDIVRNKIIESGSIMLQIGQFDISADSGNKDSEDSYITPWIIST